MQTVQVESGGKIVGNVLVMDGTLQQLTPLTTKVNSVMLRNNTNNGNVLIYSNGGVPCAFIKADETLTIDISNASEINLVGTNGQSLYWIAVTARM